MQTVGAFGSHPEDRRMAHDLDAYLDAQEAAEQRDTRIEKAAKDMCRPGQEYDPYGSEVYRYGQVDAVGIRFNMMEAIGELSNEDAAAISDAFAKARSSRVNCDLLAAARMLAEKVEAYWLNMAKHVIEREEA